MLRQMLSCFPKLINRKVTSQATSSLNESVEHVLLRAEKSSRRILSKKEEKPLFLWVSPLGISHIVSGHYYLF